PPQAFVIGISPYLDKSVKDDVYRSIIRLVVQDLPLNSTLSIYDAFDLKTITHISIPDARVFDSPKTRANQFAPAIQDLKNFLAHDHAKPAKPANAHLNFDSTLRLPQFLDFLSDNPTPRTGEVSLSPSDGERAGLSRQSRTEAEVRGT